MCASGWAADNRYFTCSHQMVDPLTVDRVPDECYSAATGTCRLADVARYCVLHAPRLRALRTELHYGGHHTPLAGVYIRQPDLT